MATQIQLRRDTAANWTSVNPVLAQGEIGVELDTLKAKIGDGTSAWSALSYAFQDGTGITSLNTLTATTQTFATGTSGTDFGISSSTSTHTFNIPDASATARGLVTTGTQTIAGAKTFSGSISASNLSGTNTGDQTITLTGDVTGSGTGSFAATIANASVTNAKLSNVSTQTFKGRTTAGTGSPEDLTATQATAILDNFVGDSGAGGTKGLVPAPASGDAAAGKFLKADGNWVAPTGSGDVVGPASSTNNGFAKFDGTTGKLLKDSAATISNSDVNASAAIARTKIANGTADHVIINNGSGTLSSEAVLAQSRGGTGFATYAVGDILYADTTSTLAKLPDVAVGSVLVSGGVNTAPSYSDTPQVARIGIGAAAGATTEITVLQPVRTSGSPSMITWTAGAHTTLAASTEATDVTYSLARTVQFATGALTLQRAMYVSAPTYAFVGASTISDAYTMVIDQPVAGTNATITRSHALWVNGRLKIGSGNTGILFRDNTSSGVNVAMYSTNVTPANTNHLLFHNGVTTQINATSSGNLQLAIDGTAVVIVNSTTLTMSTSVAGNVMSITNSTTSAAASCIAGSMATTGYNAAHGILTLTSTTGTSSTIQNFVNITKNNINADTTQEHNISWSLRDNSTSREAGKFGLRYTNTGSGTQKTKFYFRNLIGGTTLTEVVGIDGYNTFFGGSTTPTALVHIAAGTATANTAPLKFTSGTNLTTAETGAMEYNGTNLFFTRTGTTRESVFIGVSGATAPTTTAGVAITNFYGSAATNFLGDPNSWASVVVNGTTYKIPLYT